VTGTALVVKSFLTSALPGAGLLPDRGDDQVIRVVAAGDALLAPSVTRQLISEFVRRPDSDRPAPATLDVLTAREARDRTQLVVIAYETGLVTPSGP
jgi:hypothetical protein